MEFAGYSLTEIDRYVRRINEAVVEAEKWILDAVNFGEYCLSRSYADYARAQSQVIEKSVRLASAYCKTAGLESAAEKAAEWKSILDDCDKRLCNLFEEYGKLVGSNNGRD